MTAQQPIHVFNPTDSVIAFSIEITENDTNSQHFRIEPSIAEVAAGQNQQLIVYFDPDVRKTFNAELNITERTPESTISTVLHVKGRGIDLPIYISDSPSGTEKVTSLAWDNLYISLHVQKQLWVTNRSDTTVDFSFHEEQEAAGGAFTVSPLSGRIYGGGACMLTLTFAPQVARAFKQLFMLEIAGRSVQIPLSLTGRAFGPRLEFRDPSGQSNRPIEMVDLGDLTIFETHTKTLLLKNAGGIPASFTPPDPRSGGADIRFAPSHGSLAPDEAVEIRLTVTPRTLGRVNPTTCWAIEGAIDGLELQVRYKSVPPKCSLSKKQINFGERAHSFVHTEHITVTNDSPVPFSCDFDVHAEEEDTPGLMYGRKVFDVALLTAQDDDRGDAMITDLQPGHTATLAVSFVPSGPGEYAARLSFKIVDVGAIDEVPITATARIPNVELSGPAGAITDLGQVFIGEEVPLTMEVTNPSDMFGARWRLAPAPQAVRNIATVTAEETHGELGTGDEVTIRPTLTPRVTGSFTVPVLVAIDGGDAPLVHTVQYTAVGPAVEVKAEGGGATIQFGQVPVLSKSSRNIVVKNVGKIPATCIASLMHSGQSGRRATPFWIDAKDQHFTVAPHASVKVPVFLMLENDARFTDKFRLAVDLSEDTVHEVSLSAIGAGTTVCPVLDGEEAARDEEVVSGAIDLGNSFTSRPVRRTVILANLGLEEQTVSWVCELPKPTDAEGKSAGTFLHIPGAQTKEGYPSPVLEVDMPKATIQPKQQVEFVVSGVSSVPTKVSELWHIRVTKGGESNRIVFSPRFSVAFISPLFKISPESLGFRYTFHPEHEDITDSNELVTPQSLTITNAAALPQTATITCPAPFSIVGGTPPALTLPAGGSTTIDVTFDPRLASPKREYVEVPATIRLAVAGHSHQHRVPIQATVAYPDISCDGIDLSVSPAPVVDFGTCLNGSVQERRLKFTNACGLDEPVTFDWSFVEATDEVQRAVDEGRYIPSSHTFSITPTSTTLAAGESREVTITFTSHPDTKCSCTALCHIKGGPTRAVRLSGSAGAVSYTVTPTDIDFGTVTYDITPRRDVLLTNTGLVPFRWTLACSADIMSSPTGGKIEPGARTTVQIGLDHRVPHAVSGQAWLRVGYLEPVPITIKADVTFQRVGLSLPRIPPVDIHDGESQTDAEAESDRAAIERQITAAVTPGKHGRATSALLEGGRLRVRRSGQRLPLTGLVFATFRHTFGPVIGGSSGRKYDKQITVTNLGPGKATFQVDAKALARHGLSLDPLKVSNLPPGESVGLKLTLNAAVPPEGPLLVTAPIQVCSGPVRGPSFGLQVAADVIIPTLTATPSREVVFSEVFVGQAQKLPLILTNPGPLSCDYGLTLLAATHEAKKAATQFTVDPPSGTVPANDSLTVDAIFSPNTVGPHSTQVRVQASSGRAHTVGLKGVAAAPNVAVTPEAAVMPAMLPRAHGGATTALTITNGTAQAMEVYSIDFDLHYRDDITRLRTFDGYTDDTALIPVPQPRSTAPETPATVGTVAILTIDGIVSGLADLPTRLSGHWGASIVETSPEDVAEHVKYPDLPSTTPTVLCMSGVRDAGAAVKAALTALVARDRAEQETADEDEDLASAVKTLPYPVMAIHVKIPKSVVQTRAKAALEEQLNALPAAPEKPEELDAIDEEEDARATPEQRAARRRALAKYTRDAAQLQRQRGILQEGLMRAMKDLQSPPKSRPRTAAAPIKITVVTIDADATDGEIVEQAGRAGEAMVTPPTPDMSMEERYEVVTRPKGVLVNKTEVRARVEEPWRPVDHPSAAIQAESILFALTDSEAAPPAPKPSKGSTPASPRTPRSLQRSGSKSKIETEEPPPVPATTRWTVPAHGSVKVFVRFTADVECLARRRLSFGVAGFSSEMWHVMISAVSAVPTISLLPRNLFTSSRGDRSAGWIPVDRTAKTARRTPRLDEIGHFSFGAVRINRHLIEPAAPLAIEEGVATPLGDDEWPALPAAHDKHVHTIRLTNSEHFEATARLQWRYGGRGAPRDLEAVDLDDTITVLPPPERRPITSAGKAGKGRPSKTATPPTVGAFEACTDMADTTCFAVDRTELTVPPGETAEVRVIAYPTAIGPVEDLLMVGLDYNPLPVIIPFRATGDAPRLHLSSKELTFPKLLLGRHAELELQVVNPSRLSAVWRLSEASKAALAAAKMVVTPEVGVLRGRSGQAPVTMTLKVTFTADDVRAVKEDLVLDVFDCRELPEAAVRTLVPPTAKPTKKTTRTGPPPPPAKAIDPYTGDIAALLTTPLHTTSAAVGAEGYRIGVEVDLPGASNALDFGDMRVSEVKEAAITLRNVGVYDVRYKFLVDSNLRGDLVVSSAGGILPLPSEPTKGAAKGAPPVEQPGRITAVISFDRETTYHSTRGLRLQIVEDSTGEVVDTIDVGVRGRSSYNRWKVTPARALSFGALASGATKTRSFELANTGRFPFNFAFGTIADIKAAETKRRTAAKEHRAAALKAVRAGESLPETTDPVVVQPVTTGGDLVCGEGQMFRLTPQTGSIAPDESVRVSVEFTPTGRWEGVEVLGVDITGADAAVQVGPALPDLDPADLCTARYAIDGESAIPGIDVDDLRAVFEEHTVVQNLALAAKIKDSVFAVQERLFQFGQVLPNKTVTARFNLLNPFKVPVDMNITIEGREQARPSSKAGTKAGAKGTKTDDAPLPFTVEPATLLIPPRQSRYISCHFTPTLLQEASARLRATAAITPPPAPAGVAKGKGNDKVPKDADVQLARHQQLVFDVAGEGSLPHVTLIQPDPVTAATVEARISEQVGDEKKKEVKKDGKDKPRPGSGAKGKPAADPREVADQYALFFGRIMAGSTSQRVLSFKCAGDLATTARVRIVRQTPEGAVAPGPECPFTLNAGETAHVATLRAREETETITVTFAPREKVEGQYVVRLSVDDNPFETTTIPLYGQSFTTDLVALDLPGDETSILRIADSFPSAPQTVSIKLANTSGRSLRYDWTLNDELRARHEEVEATKRTAEEEAKGAKAKKPAKTKEVEPVPVNLLPAGITVHPAVGFLGPGQEQMIDVTVASDEPLVHTPTDTTLACHYCPVQTVDDDWNDAMRCTEWVTPTDADLEAGATPRPDGLIKVTRPVPEPESTRIGDEVALSLGLACVCAPPEYALGAPQEEVEYDDGSTATEYSVSFAETVMFQERSYTFPLENTGSVALDYAWLIAPELDSTERGTGLPFVEDPGFTITPQRGSVPPGETLTMRVSFKPRQALVYRTAAMLELKGLESTGADALPVVLLEGTAQQPLIHFDLPESDYITSGRRDSDRPTPPDWDLPRTKVIEIASRGLRVRSTGSFTVLNPTSQIYDFTWTAATKTSAVRVLTSSGRLEPGKPREMVIEYVPATMEPVDYYLTLSIPQLRLTMPFLAHCRPSEPEVSLSASRVSFDSQLVGTIQSQTVSLINSESMPFAFKFTGRALHQAVKGATPAVTITPASGVAPANTTVELRVDFEPSAEEGYNYQLTGHVDRMATPLTINVKGVGFAVHDELLLAGPEPTRLTSDAVNGIDLGTLYLQEKRAKTFHLLNKGRFPLSYTVRTADSRHLTVTPASGTVQPGGRGEISATFYPQAETDLAGHRIIVQVSSGPTYRIALAGKARRPRLSFTPTHHDFGPQFIYHGGMPPEAIAKVDVVVTNNDAHTLSIDPIFDATKAPHLAMPTAAPTTLAPAESVTFTVEFRPGGATTYKNLLPFVVNGLITMHVTLEGSGTPVTLECPTKEVSVGPIPVGSRRTRTVRFVNRSRAPAPITLEPFDPVHGLSVGMLTEPVKDRRTKTTKPDTGPPQQELTLRPDHAGLVTITYQPRSRAKPFTRTITGRIAGDVFTLCTVSGAALGREVTLDTESIIFPPVVYGNKVTRTVTLQNNGDIDTHFTWDLAGLGTDFKVAPSTGIARADSDTAVTVTFEPTSIADDIRAPSVTCVVEGVTEPLTVALSGSSVAVSDAADEVAFNCAVRDSDTQSVTVENPTDVEWQLRPSVMAAGALQQTIKAAQGEDIADAALPAPANLYGSDLPFATDHLLVVPSRGSARLPVRYSPLTMTRDEPVRGSLLLPLPDGTTKLYTLLGTATEPADAGHSTWNTIAKFTYKSGVEVANWLGVSQRFTAEIVVTDAYDAKIDKPPTKTGSRASSRRQSTETNVQKAQRNPALLDVIAVTGPQAIDVPALSAREYPVTVECPVAAVFNGHIVFTNPKSGEYVKSTFEVGVAPPGFMSTIQMTTPARIAATSTIRLENPLAEPVTFTGKSTAAGIRIPETTVVQPRSSATVELVYLPLVPTELVREELSFTSEKLGVFKHKLELTATPPRAERALHFKSALGKSLDQSGRILSLRDAPTTYKATVDSPDFTVAPTVQAGPGGESGVEVSFDIRYAPSRLGEARATLTLSDPQAGVFTVPLIASCHAPQPQGPVTIPTTGSVPIQFRSPFREAVTVKYHVSGGDKAFVLSSRGEMLAPDKAAALNVSFKPQPGATDTHSAMLVITAEPADGPVRWQYYLQGVEK